MRPPAAWDVRATVEGMGAAWDICGPQRTRGTQLAGCWATWIVVVDRFRGFLLVAPTMASIPPGLHGVPGGRLSCFPLPSSWCSLRPHIPPVLPDSLSAPATAAAAPQHLAVTSAQILSKVPVFLAAVFAPASVLPHAIPVTILCPAAFKVKRARPILQLRPARRRIQPPQRQRTLLLRRQPTPPRRPQRIRRPKRQR